MAKKRELTEAEADKINQYLGANTWEAWETLDSEGRIQIAKRAQIDQALWKSDKSLYTALSPYGTDYTDKVRQDLIHGLDLLLASKFPDPGQFWQLFKLYEVVVDTADLLLKEAEMIPVTGLILGAVSVKTLGLAASVGRLRHQLLVLDALLSEAQYLKLEAQIQQAFGIISNTIGLLVPGLSLIAKGGMTAADLLLDDQLGPKKPELESTAGDSAKGINYVLDIMQEMERVGKTTKTVAKHAGRTLQVTGFWFDAREVGHANKLIDKIQKKMDECRKEYDDVVPKLKEAIALLRKAQKRMEALVRPLRDAAIVKRMERDKLLRAVNFSSINGAQWRLVDDFNPATRRLAAGGVR